MKLTKRKGFNFFRSYYDVFNELEDKDKLPFIEALLDRQFLGVKPKGLTGMAKFAYISQTNSIDSQVKGYEDKTKTKLLNTLNTPPCEGVKTPPTVQVQVEEKGEVEEKEKVQVVVPTFQDFQDYAYSKSVDFDEEKLRLKYLSWIENDWKDGNDKKIKNWKTKLLNTLPFLKKEKSSEKKESYLERLNQI